MTTIPYLGAQTRSILMCVNWTSCVQRVRCGVRCDSSSPHRAFANMHIQVSCMDVLRAILVGAAIILRRGAFLVHTEQGISYVALTVNTCLLACKKKSGNTSQGYGQDLTRYDMTWVFSQGTARHEMMWLIMAGHEMTRKGST